MQNISGRINDKYLKIRNQIYKRCEENRHKSDNYWTHVTYYSVGNVGDTCLSRCVRKTIEGASLNNSWEIVEVGAPVTEATVASINRSKALLIGGGGLFLPDTNKNNISGWQWAVSEQQFNQINVPIFVFSVGYNYFRGQTPEPLFVQNLNLLCERAAFIGLRNNGSVKAVQELLPADLQHKVVYQPCTTTLIRKTHPNLPQKQYSSKNICINMAFDREEQRYGSNKEKILKAVALAVKAISEQGYNIHYIAHMKSDLKFLPYLQQQNIQFETHASYNWLPDKLINFYNKMDLVMGMRGHSQMIPFGINCEIMSLGTHEKMKWFLEDIGAPEWYIELNSDPEKLTDNITNAFYKIHVVEKDITHKKLIDAQEKLWQITQNNLNLLKTLS